MDWEAWIFFCHPGPLQLYRLLRFLIGIQWICFHVLPPCFSPLLLPVLKMRCRVQHPACCLCRKSVPEIPLPVSGSSFPVQSPRLMPQGQPLPAKSLGRDSTSWKMPRQLHPWPIYSAQILEQLQVFAFVLGLNTCLAISQSYLRCRGVVRLHNLTQPVTSYR